MLVVQSYSGGATTDTGFYREETGLILIVQEGKPTIQEGSPTIQDFYHYRGTVTFGDGALRFSLEVWRGGGEMPAIPPTRDPWGLLERLSLEALYNYFAHGVQTSRNHETGRYTLKFWCEYARDFYASDASELEWHLTFMLAALDRAIKREWEHSRDYPPTQHLAPV